jgi:N-acetylneuraminic acid mutarotase
MGIAVLHGRIAVFGGCFAAPGSPQEIALGSAELYDPAADAWAPLPSLQQPRCRLAGVSLGGKLYAMGGMTQVPYGTALDSVEVLDPAAGAWHFAAPAPAPLVNARAVVLAGSILVITESAAYEYDPTADRWSSAPPTLAHRSAPSAAVRGGRAYVMGGVTALGEFLASVESFDKAFSTWTLEVPIPTARFALAAAVARGKIYALGGLDPSYARLATNEEGDVVHGTWVSRAPMPTPRAYPGAVSLGGDVYVIGGLVPVTIHGATTAVVEEYTPDGVRALPDGDDP